MRENELCNYYKILIVTNGAGVVRDVAAVPVNTLRNYNVTMTLLTSSLLFTLCHIVCQSRYTPLVVVN